MKQMESDDKKKLEQERAELNTLINKGVSFEVKDIEFDVEKHFFGLIKKYKPREAIEMSLDESEMKTEDSMKRARGLAHKHSIRCARVVAIAVLGEDRLIPVCGKGGTRWVEDVKRLDELTSLFARTIKPSVLYKLYVLVNAMCNLGDFLNSIRLVQQERTTMPIRIEENNEG